MCVCKKGFWLYVCFYFLSSKRQKVWELCLDGFSGDFHGFSFGCNFCVYDDYDDALEVCDSETD